jgi:hypothetical protein
VDIWEEKDGGGMVQKFRCGLNYHLAGQTITLRVEEQLPSSRE